MASLIYPLATPRTTSSAWNNREFVEPSGPDFELVRAIHRHDDGYLTFHQKNFAGRFFNLCSVWPLVLAEPDSEKLLPHLTHDSFFSINAFYRAGYGRQRMVELKTSELFPPANRSTRDVRYLNAAFVDIDCQTVGLQAAEVELVAAQLEREGVIPPASAVVRSGRGIWLLWFLTNGGQPVSGHPRKLAAWRGIQEIICNLFRPYGADQGATDVPRVMRVPGSINTKTGAAVEYWLDASLQYTLDELKLHFNAVPRVPLTRRRREPGSNPTPGRKRGARTLNERRLADFEFLIIGGQCRYSPHFDALREV